MRKDPPAKKDPNKWKQTEEGSILTHIQGSHYRGQLPFSKIPLDLLLFRKALCYSFLDCIDIIATQTLRLDDTPAEEVGEEEDPFQSTTFEVTDKSIMHVHVADQLEQCIFTVWFCFTLPHLLHHKLFQRLSSLLWN